MKTKSLLYFLVFSCSLSVFAQEQLQDPPGPHCTGVIREAYENTYSDAFLKERNNTCRGLSQQAVLPEVKKQYYLEWALVRHTIVRRLAMRGCYKQTTPEFFQQNCQPIWDADGDGFIN